MKINSGLGMVGLAAALAATHVVAQVATQRLLQVALAADQANAQATTQVVPVTRAAGQPDPAQTPAAGAAAAAARVPGQSAGQGRPLIVAVGVPVLGMPFVHDPSTVVRFKRKYYVYSTGRGAPFYSSPDGETWTREGSVF